jgi:hypothetical protein
MEYKIKSLRNEIEKIEAALDIISKYENGDSLNIKQPLRNKVEELEREIEELESEDNN